MEEKMAMQDGNNYKFDRQFFSIILIFLQWREFSKHSYETLLGTILIGEHNVNPSHAIDKALAVVNRS